MTMIYTQKVQSLMDILLKPNRWLWYTQKVQPLMGILLKPDDYDNTESTTFNGHSAKAR